jgi:hypothetical protein
MHLRTHGSRSRSRSDSGWKWKGVDENKTPKNKRLNEYGETDRTRVKQTNGLIEAMKQNEAMDVQRKLKNKRLVMSKVLLLLMMNNRTEPGHDAEAVCVDESVA